MFHEAANPMVMPAVRHRKEFVREVSPARAKVRGVGVGREAVFVLGRVVGNALVRPTGRRA